MENIRREVDALQRDHVRFEREIAAIRATTDSVIRTEAKVTEILWHMKGDDNDPGLLKRVSDLEKDSIRKSHLAWLVGTPVVAWIIAHANDLFQTGGHK